MKIYAVQRTTNADEGWFLMFLSTEKDPTLAAWYEWFPVSAQASYDRLRRKPQMRWRVVEIDTEPMEKDPISGVVDGEPGIEALSLVLAEWPD